MRVVTLLIPAYNEAENLAEVLPEALSVLRICADDYEIVVVDDGSTDGTPETMARLVSDNPHIISLRLRRNSGKSYALKRGLQIARGDTVVLMDADGQDDPRSIPLLLERIEGGLDLVTGRRAQRQDRFIKRTTSRLYNWVTARMTGVPGEDFNSGLKAFRREVADQLDLYGDLHRYIPVLASWQGFEVGEVDVPHFPRRHGQSKFGPARFWRGFLDLLTVKLITSYRTRPLHLFGGAGLLLGGIGAGLLSWMLTLRILGERVGGRPAFLTGVMLVVVAVQLVSVGLVAELIVHLMRANLSTVTRLQGQLEQGGRVVSLSQAKSRSATRPSA